MSSRRSRRSSWLSLVMLVVYGSGGGGVPTVSATSYLSFYEAVTVQQHNSLCMSNCDEHNGQQMCVVAWHGNMAKCRRTGKFTLGYKTIDSANCTSNCGRFDDENYEWCATDSDNWDKCTRTLALSGRRTVLTPNKYAVCRDACESRTSSYTWCKTVDNSWQKCNPNDFTHTYDYTTESGDKCDGRCLLYEGKANCYNTKSKWERCFLNPSYSWWLNQLDLEFKSLNCLFDAYETPHNHVKCASSNHHTDRSERAADDHLKNELYFECDSAVDAVMMRHIQHNPTVVVRRPNISDMITEDRNPILSYTMLPTISYFTEVGEDARVDLPLVIDALLTTHTLLPVGADREHFSNDVNNNYDKMDRLLTHLNYDERGHILASRLGGPMERFNVFPQSWRMNRGRNSMWYGLEGDIDTFLRNNPNRYVRFTAVLSYATDDNHVLRHRASAIMLRVRAFDNGVQVNLDGDPVTAQNPNTTENMYFSNDPDHSCEPLPASPPRRRRPRAY